MRPVRGIVGTERGATSNQARGLDSSKYLSTLEGRFDSGRGESEGVNGPTPVCDEDILSSGEVV